MVVQHNLQALNSNRMLGVNQKTVAGSTEKLSSGYKINRAADDAAGLSISEKMRKQIRGLTQASANAEDGISSVQTAEGALQEVTDMLQRMNELAVQAANGTNSETDRGYIQDEIDQLVTEIDRVAETTKFNETYLLKGDATKGTTAVYTESYTVTALKNTGINSGSVTVRRSYTGNNTLILATTSMGNATKATAVVISAGDEVTQYLSDNTTIKSASYAAFSLATASSVKASVTISSTGAIQVNTGSISIYDKANNMIITLKAGEDISSYVTNVTSKNGKTVDYMDAAEGYQFLTKSSGDKTITTDAIKGEGQLYDAQGNAVSGVGLKNYYSQFGIYKGGLYTDSEGQNSVTQASKYVNITKTDVASDLSIGLHVGADSASANKITAKIATMTAASLGIDALKSSQAGIKDATGAKATDAIDIISSALQKVSTQRSALGAIQNRLEHTIKNLDNVVENTTSAESSIRDTDMATEMVKYSNANILSQAGQSMLAQANQSNQGVLALL